MNNFIAINQEFSDFRCAPQMASIFQDAFAIKNLDHRIVVANQSTCKYFGYNCATALVNDLVTESEIHSPMSECAEIFYHEEDLVVRENKTIRTINYLKHLDGKFHWMVGCKSPYVNQSGQIDGVVIQGFDFENSPIFNASSLLKNFQSFPYNKIFNGQFGFIIEKNFPEIDLPIRQTECLFYLINGFTTKEIARTLNISYRTVDYYLEIIRNKLTCSNRQELIEKAIHLGFLSIIPESILNQWYS